MRTVTRTMLWALLVTLCVMARPAAGQQSGAAGKAGAAGVQVDKNSVGGVVLNSNGGKPEAGVWVIAETKSLPAPFRKIVVTDEQGRFLVPDMPDGSYELWVRGYGLKDSDHVSAARGAKSSFRSRMPRPLKRRRRFTPPAPGVADSSSRQG